MSIIIIHSENYHYGQYLKTLVEQVSHGRKLKVSDGSQVNRESWNDSPGLLVFYAGSKEISFIDKVRTWGKVPKIIITNNGVHHQKTHDSIYLSKPLDAAEFVKCIYKHCYSKDLGFEINHVPTEPFLIGNSCQLRELRKKIAKIGKSGLSVLICGQTGTGKGVVALSLHNSSRQRENALKYINCANVPNSLLESELFGYRKGAFTGAWRDKPGMLQQAGEGTVFLDEISEMSPYMQAKLLHVLQEKEFYPIGGTSKIKIKARVLAATNANLRKAIFEGSFREDLYYRLAVFRLDLPPLKERMEDIPLLAQYFLDKYCRKYNKLDYDGLSDEILNLIHRYEWPGNVRELESCINGLVALGSEEMVLEELYRKIPQNSEVNDIYKYNYMKEVTEWNWNVPLKEAINNAVYQAEKDIIQKALKSTGGKKKLAASVLRVSYKSLLKKIKVYGL